MPLLLLFYLILTTLPPWSRPPAGLGPVGCAGLAAGLIALPTLTAWLLALLTRRRLRAAPHRRVEIGRRFARGKLFQLYGLMAAHLLALALGWGWAAREAWAAWAYEPLVMAPFVVALGLTWA